MTQSGFRTTQNEAPTGAFGSRASEIGGCESPHLANLSGRANLTPDEYLILFGDSPPEPLDQDQVAQDQPAVVIDEPTPQPASQTRAQLRLAKLTAHPYLSAAVLFISVLVGAAIARGWMG